MLTGRIYLQWLDLEAEDDSHNKLVRHIGRSQRCAQVALAFME
jgi:hypothetical protein